MMPTMAPRMPPPWSEVRKKTDEELSAQADKLLESGTEREPRIPMWHPGQPTPPELLAIKRNRESGQPLEEQYPKDAPTAEDPHLRDQRLTRNAERYAAWVALALQEKNQLVMDLQYGHEDCPRWDVWHEEGKDTPDSAYTPLSVPAPTEYEAILRYQKVMKINECRPPAMTRAVRAAPPPAPATPPPAAAEGKPGTIRKL